MHNARKAFFLSFMHHSQSLFMPRTEFFHEERGLIHLQYDEEEKQKLKLNAIREMQMIAMGCKLLQ
jgi:hypothetical protein